jgi:predicted NBD/HSP70 family sugar kinase
MYVAIDIGGTKTLITTFTVEGDVITSVKFPTNKRFKTFLKELIEGIDGLINHERVDCIAVAIPALIDHETGIAKSFGNLDWKNVDITTSLKENYTENVYIDNDAKMGALGEANMGAGVGHETCLYVTVSTGIGIGITYQGQLDKALEDSEGGQMGFRHEGKIMRWEKFASGKAFYEEFGARGEDDNNPEHWRVWAEDLALGMNSLISVIQPDIVIIGGSMGNHLHKYHSYLHKTLQTLRGPTVKMPMIVAAKDPDNAVINGCLVVCKQHNQD